jgi:hypothetical protein
VAGFGLLSTVKEHNLQKKGKLIDLPNDVEKQKLKAVASAAAAPGFGSALLSLLMFSAELNTNFYGTLSKLSYETLYEVPFLERFDSAAACT